MSCSESSAPKRLRLEPDRDLEGGARRLLPSSSSKLRLEPDRDLLVSVRRLLPWLASNKFRLELERDVGVSFRREQDRVGDLRPR